MAVCGMIVLFIRSELGYDDFEPNGDRVYRIVLDRKYPGRTTAYAIIPTSIGEAVHKEFPGGRRELPACRISPITASCSSRPATVPSRKTMSWWRILIFSAFFPPGLMEGDPVTALRKPFTVVLTEGTATAILRLARRRNGQNIGDGRQSIISRSPPSAQTFRPIPIWPMTFLCRRPAFPCRSPTTSGFPTYTYVLLNPHANPAVLESKLPTVVEKYVSGVIARTFNMSYQQFQQAGNGYHYYLQPLRRIHLTSDLEAEMRPNGSMRSIYIFGIIAIFILCIACVNFINLSTARSVERAKEVGIRKTFGSDRRSLVLQFLVESILVSLLSMVLSVLLMWLLLPLFSQLSGKDLSLLPVLEPARIGLLIVFAVLVGLLAGIYPAFVLSSFQPIKVLKGKFKSNRYGAALRNGLVVFQFAISIILIVCTVTVNRQCNICWATGSDSGKIM